MRSRFLQRGYSKKILRKAFNRAKVLDRDRLLHRAKKAETTPSTKFITRYVSEHSAIRDILTKHWPIWMTDNKVKRFIGDHPELTFRKTKSICDHLVSSHYRGSSRGDPCLRCGAYRCGACEYCPYIDNVQTKILPNGRHHEIHFVNCKTAGVVYLMTCDCPSFYVGKTKRPFWVRIADHIRGIRKGDMHAPIARHVTQCHKGNPRSIKFYPLDHTHTPP